MAGLGEAGPRSPTPATTKDHRSSEISGPLRIAVEAGGWLGLNASGTPEVPASAAEVGGLESGVAAELFAFAFHRNPARLQHVGIGGNFKREVGVLLH